MLPFFRPQSQFSARQVQRAVYALLTDVSDYRSKSAVADRPAARCLPANRCGPVVMQEPSSLSARCRVDPAAASDFMTCQAQGLAMMPDGMSDEQHRRCTGHCGLNAVWLQQDARRQHRAPVRRHGHQLRHAHADAGRHHPLALTLLSCMSCRLLCEMALTLLNDCSAVRRSTQSDCGAHGSAACMTPAFITLKWTFICHLPGHQVIRDPAVLSGRGHGLRPAAVTARRPRVHRPGLMCGFIGTAGPRAVPACTRIIPAVSARTQAIPLPGDSLERRGLHRTAGLHGAVST